jgi:uncharacterized protein YeaO (DUF488 family)
LTYIGLNIYNRYCLFDSQNMLKSKCILADKSIDDGQRISIMSRHTLNDGKTPDERIWMDTFDMHLPDFWPQPKLVWKYYRNEIDFENYAKEYKESLNTKQASIKKIIEWALIENITVLCIEESSEFCHRKIFVETAQELAKVMWVDLEIEIK